MTEASKSSLGGQFWLGVNYWPRHRGVAIWTDWHPEEIDSEFGEMAALGLNVARIFVKWEDFQPIREYRAYQLTGEPVHRCLVHDENLDDQTCPDLVDERMVDRLAEVCEFAEKHGLKLIVAIFVGWMSGACFDPPFMRGRCMFTDPTLLRYEVMLCRHLARRFRDDNRILAWDLGNEQNCFQAVPSIDAAWHWTYLLTSTLRRNDRNHAVMSGMHSLGTTRKASQGDSGARFLIKEVAEHTDCLTVHPYPDFVPTTLDPPLDPRGSLISSWQLRLYQGLGRIPVMSQEFGTLGDGCMGRDVAADYTRRTLYSLLGNGCIGALWWCHTDFTGVDKMPYRTNIMEANGLGLHDAQGNVKPVGRVFREFSAVLKQLDLANLTAIKPRAAIILPWDSEHSEVVFNAFTLAKRASLDVDIVSPDDPLLGYDLLILPSYDSITPFTQPQWARIRERVADGATLYVSSGGVNLPGLDEMAGVTLRWRHAVSGRRTAIGVSKQAGFPGDLTWDGYSSKAPLVVVTSGSVIATNSEGDPFLIAHDWKQGKVVLVTEPIERYLCGKPGISATDESWRLYHYLKTHAGITDVVESGHPNVECSLMQEGRRLLVVLTNHSAETVEVPLTTGQGIAKLMAVDGAVYPMHGGRCVIALGANQGVILRA